MANQITKILRDMMCSKDGPRHMLLLRYERCFLSQKVRPMFPLLGSGWGLGLPQPTEYGGNDARFFPQGWVLEL